MKRCWLIWVCSALLLVGCKGLTFGPVVEKKAIIVRAGTGIEILEQVTVEARLLRKEEESDVFQQDIGGWIALHPDHWEAVKREIQSLRSKVDGP